MLKYLETHKYLDKDENKYPVVFDGNLRSKHKLSPIKFREVGNWGTNIFDLKTRKAFESSSQIRKPDYSVW